MAGKTVLKAIDWRSYASLSFKLTRFIGAWIASILIGIILLIGIFMTLFSFTSFATISTGKVLVGVAIAVAVVLVATVLLVLLCTFGAWLKAVLYTLFAKAIGGIAGTLKKQGQYTGIIALQTASIVRWACLAGGIAGLIAGIIAAAIVHKTVVSALLFFGVLLLCLIVAMLAALIFSSLYNWLVRYVGPFQLKLVQRKRNTDLTGIHVWQGAKWAAVFAVFGVCIQIVVRALVVIFAPQTPGSVLTLVFVVVLAPFSIVVSAAIRAAIYAVYNWAAKKYNPIQLTLSA